MFTGGNCFPSLFTVDQIYCVSVLPVLPNGPLIQVNSRARHLSASYNPPQSSVFSLQTLISQNLLNLFVINYCHFPLPKTQLLQQLPRPLPHPSLWLVPTVSSWSHMAKVQL